MAFVHIHRCADDSFYVGSTTDPDLRLWQHNHTDDGAACTRKRRPVVLAWAAEFGSIIEAFASEKRVQGWGRAKREALIRDEYDLLPLLASRSYAGEEARRRFRDGP